MSVSHKIVICRVFLRGADRGVWQWSAMVLIGAQWITCKENIMELGQKLKKTVIRVFRDLQTLKKFSSRTRVSTESV